MITDDLENINFYSNINNAIKEALEFIKVNISCSSKEQRYEINNNMYSVVETSKPKKSSNQKLEIHRKYIDVQYIIDGYDVIGWKSLSNCKKIYKNYDKSKDIAFFNDYPDFNIILKQGSFSVFFQQDAHAPLCGKLPVKKCIVKVIQAVK
ncbi:MAG: YhcH/YjgK/YiaL family protein [Endomicrobium sp.]|jgi:YhcH/YjgK/YiaL family protein|nr:YhcH/YjgK/YiaL family protein [Endomicrobium sp.]